MTQEPEELTERAVRDICSVSVAPASKSEVRRILKETVAQAEKRGAQRERERHNKELSKMFQLGYRTGMDAAIKEWRAALEHPEGKQDLPDKAKE